MYDIIIGINFLHLFIISNPLEYDKYFCHLLRLIMIRCRATFIFSDVQSDFYLIFYFYYNLCFLIEENSDNSTVAKMPLGANVRFRSSSLTYFARHAGSARKIVSRDRIREQLPSSGPARPEAIGQGRYRYGQRSPPLLSSPAGIYDAKNLVSSAEILAVLAPIPRTTLTARTKPRDPTIHEDRL